MKHAGGRADATGNVNYIFTIYGPFLVAFS